MKDIYKELMIPAYDPADLVIHKGEGPFLWDREGNKYIDFSAGVAVCALGHCHPQLNIAMHEQASLIWQIGNGYINEPSLAIAQRLISATFGEKIFFANSGAEANEAALKLARRYILSKFGVSKSEIISFYNSFHGRTLFTVNVGGQDKYSAGFGKKIEDIRHVAFNELSSLELIGDNTCAVIIEPIQGEGGIVAATPEFLHRLRTRCSEVGALLIMDEVQTGMGRTGELFAYQALGVVPDILTVGKGLGGGFPISAVITTTEISNAFYPGIHGSTFGGNPLGTAIAKACFDIIYNREFLSRVSKNGKYFVSCLDKINLTYNCFKEIRGLGLMIGAELKGAFTGEAKNIVRACVRNGLIANVAGPNVLRFTPSLNIDVSVIDEGLNILHDTMAAFHERKLMY